MRFEMTMWGRGLWMNVFTLWIGVVITQFLWVDYENEAAMLDSAGRSEGVTTQLPNCIP